MENKSLIGELVFERLSELISPEEYIKPYLYFYSESCKKSFTYLKRPEVEELYKNFIDNPFFELDDLITKMDDDISIIMERIKKDERSEDWEVFLDGLKQAYYDLKNKFKKESILGEIETYNSTVAYRIAKNKLSKMTQIDTNNKKINDYFKRITKTFTRYCYVIEKYLSLPESGNYKQRLDNTLFELTNRNPIQRISSMKNELIKQGFIDETTTAIQFRNIFLGATSSKPIIWIDSERTLHDFIIMLFETKKVKPIKNKWEIVAQLFIDKKGGRYDFKNLRKAKRKGKTKTFELKLCCNKL